MAARAQGIRAGAAYVELGVKNSQLIKGLNVASARLKAFGAGVQAIGTRLAGLGVTLGVPLLGAAKLFAGMGDDAAKAAARTGVAVEALTELRYAAERSGAGAEDLERGLRAMSRTIIEAARGSKQAQRDLARLGLTVADLTGLSPDQQFELIASRLQRIRNPANQATIAMEIFGRMAGPKLLPLLASGAKGIQELREEARLVGRSMSTEDAQAAEAFTDALTNLFSALKRVVFAVGGALAPTLQQIAGWVTRVAVNVGAWIDANREVATIIGGVIAGLTATGIALTVLGPAISAVGSAIGLVVSTIFAGVGAIKLLAATISFLLSPIGLVTVAVSGIATAVLFATKEGSQALGALRQGFDQLLGAVSATWQGIRDAIVAGDLAGAMEVAWLGLQAAWETGIAAIRASWRSFQSFFVESFWGAAYAVARAFSTAWTGIEVAFWSVVNALSDGWDTFCVGLQIAFGEFVGFFRRAWAQVRNTFNREAARREVEAINREIEQQNQEARERLNQRVQQRAGRVDQARERGRELEETLNQMQKEERRRRQQEIEVANAADQARAAAAQRALEERVGELADQRDWLELERQMEQQLAAKERRKKSPDFDLEGLDEVVAKVDTRGTFNALALAGLGSDSLAERTARASEEVAANTKRLVREVENGGLVFA